LRQADIVLALLRPTAAVRAKTRQGHQRHRRYARGRRLQERTHYARERRLGCRAYRSPRRAVLPAPSL